ncbi:nicotinamide-nucleotide amidase [Chitinivorax sp. PXF-14]|uniref:nicotinamide-nucleotide amidase n=1 Tax=Chitinivorax sp. PXF-14 TaxID=3230488 RepID=UPI003466297F
MADAELLTLARGLGERLLARGLWLATAESCTGGWISEALTAVPGSSAWFDRAYVTYSNRAKQQMLGVSGEALAQFGAVSALVVSEMASGAQSRADVDLAVAVSGVAGPSGGSVEKPVGTVWIAWASRAGVVRCERFMFAGDREAVRRATVIAALQGLLDLAA